MKEAFNQAQKAREAIPYPCGYQMCTNPNLTILGETENDITVYCAVHDAKTTWLKEGIEKPLHVIKPEWKKFGISGQP